MMDTQVDMLDQFWDRLADDAMATAPVELDPGLAALTRQLTLAFAPANPTPVFQARLRRRLLASSVTPGQRPDQGWRSGSVRLWAAVLAGLGRLRTVPDWTVTVAVVALMALIVFSWTLRTPQTVEQTALPTAIPVQVDEPTPRGPVLSVPPADRTATPTDALTHTPTPTPGPDLNSGRAALPLPPTIAPAGYPAPTRTPATIETAPSRTPGPTRTPEALATAATRTPEPMRTPEDGEPRPMRTPVPTRTRDTGDPEATWTPLPTRTTAPSRTPAESKPTLTPLPTRTPGVAPVIPTPLPPRPTWTPRPTRTPVTPPPTRTPLPARPTHTPAPAEPPPTRTPPAVAPRPTQTPSGDETKPTATPPAIGPVAPTRTPGANTTPPSIGPVAPTRTPDSNAPAPTKTPSK